MKKFLSMTFCLFFLASCLLVWDTMESMRIKNCTTDTLLIGASFSNNIDSVYIKEYGGRLRFLPRTWAKCDYTWTIINEKGMLEISSQDYIPQDSTADYAESGSLFSHNRRRHEIILGLRYAMSIYMTLYSSPERCWNKGTELNTSDTRSDTRDRHCHAPARAQEGY